MRAFILLVSAVFLLACNSNRLPKGVLPPEKMETVLWDMIQADEFLRNYMLTIDTSLNDTTESIRMYEKVFRMHKTSRQEFKKSFDYYRTHTSLIKKVLDSLNVKSTQVPPEVNESKPSEKIDSAALRKKIRKPL
ncbi:MAG TPA: DUF4296 domain-containing protein [Chitinophagaceae bacterium]